MIPLLVIIALAVLAILAVALRLAIDVRAIRATSLPDIHAALLRQAWSYPMGHFHLPAHDVSRMAAFHLNHMHMSMSGNFASWEWRDGGWRLASPGLPSGVDPGPPPAQPGTYEGEVVTTRLPDQE
jgi:hypothetical protein